VTFPAYSEVLPLACTATKRPNGDIRMAVAMQKLESTESDRMRAGDPEVANSPDSGAQNVIPIIPVSHDSCVAPGKVARTRLPWR
jgi:hypothetical protein